MSAFIITLVFFICDAAAHLYIQKYHKADGVEGRGGAVTKVLLMPSLYMSLHLAGLAFGRTLANEELVRRVRLWSCNCCRVDKSVDYPLLGQLEQIVRL